jgi:tetratricopeptide (TPR) repeat protein
MKVFLSSTYLDLIEHRKAVVNALRTMGEEVDHMEIFGARDEEPTLASLEELDKCDVLVGVYAYRYGTIPKGSKTSVTEQEYFHAMSKEKPILVFVVNEDYDWPPKKMDESLTKIKKFKAKAAKEHTPEYFTSPDNLASKVVSSVGRLAKKLSPKPAFDSSSPIPYSSPKPTGSTLPNQPYFFGRVEELKTIAQALSPETRAWGALIDGPGGIGKTALAIRAAHLSADTLFERKIFITAKVRELTPEGEKKLTDFTRPTYLTMLDELGKELGEENISRLAPEERPDALRLNLAGKKALIIFDNLETLPEEERTRLFQFVSRLPEGNKAIVTSRRRSDVDARIVRLDRLSHDEAMQLIAELATKYARLRHASQTERDDLYAITQGNPLFIRWITGQLGREGSQCHTIAEACGFLAKAPKGNDPLEYIFGDLLGTFTENEMKALAALTHFTQPARPKWIAQMTELPERAVETALEDLTDRSILTSDLSGQTYLLPPLAAQFIRARKPEAVTRTGDVLIDHAYALVMQYGGNKSADYEKYPILDAEWELVAAALPRFLTGPNDRLQTVCNQLTSFLDFTGRWDDQLWLSTQAEAQALSANDKENAGWRSYYAGFTYYLQNQPAEVLTYADRAAEYWKDSTPRNKAVAVQLRGLGHKLRKEYPAAIAAYREAWNIHRSISLESGPVVSVLNDLAEVERINIDYPAAERDYKEALRIAKKTNYHEGIAELTGNLAELALDREQWVEAESLAREALALSEKVGRKELVASNCGLIAQSLLKQNHKLEEALSFSRRAIEIYTRLKSPGLQWAQETLAEIEETMRKSES